MKMQNVSGCLGLTMIETLYRSYSPHDMFREWEIRFRDYEQ